MIVLIRTSSLLTSLFLIAFCAAALVAMRRPSAASLSFCCCSSLSGLAAAPWDEKVAGKWIWKKGHSETVKIKKQQQPLQPPPFLQWHRPAVLQQIGACVSSPGLTLPQHPSWWHWQDQRWPGRGYEPDEPSHLWWKWAKWNIFVIYYWWGFIIS